MSAQLNQVTTQIGTDPDMQETKEWLDALEAVLENEGPERAHYLMERMVDLARRRGGRITRVGPDNANTSSMVRTPRDRRPKSMFVKQRMTANPFTVTPDVSIPDALAVMEEHGVRHLPVVDAGAVVGVISRNDIAAASPSKAVRSTR